MMKKAISFVNTQPTKIIPVHIALSRVIIVTAGLLASVTKLKVELVNFFSFVTVSITNHTTANIKLSCLGITE